MDKVRKNIVLKEIKYWKEHRLLPEQYCDFLLSLYTEGSAAEQQLYEQKSHSSTIKKFLYQLLYIYLMFQLVMTLVVIYFTEISIDLQITLLTIFVIVSFISIIFFYKKKQPFFHVALIVGILILFLTTVHLVSTIFIGSQISLLITIFLNCVFWIFTGFRMLLKYLVISGIVGAMLLVIYVFI